MITKNQMQIKAEPGRQELFVVREFDAPREKVYRAFTDPKLVVQWLGPKNMTMTIDYYDCTTGGKYRYIHTDPNGNAYGFNGVVHEATEPERVIQTFEFEGMPERGHVVLDSAVFDDLPDGRSKVTIHSVYGSVADRDGMIQSGMEHGMREGFDRLDDLLDNQ
ncbi:SRPBCC family protein [Flavihumibacter petaseus]|uniref:Activator of Hsp90 ATPase homologue 1/2-like C-terminal domain-containing protein n=1 Tax=Flavihumibacter petaseus NBRC 106054 TaxID=1220578 RepID=A0A0E9MTE9_9BACT|nr:SRPBCC family protein [Flavihumibacter petaseus]GAO41032.1 hypothetical protein FPE01S_01_00440 [Flavihumibacter petaseus NBRC 106054]